MLNSIINTVLFRNYRKNIVKDQFVKMIESKAAEGFLDILLNLMALMFCVDKDFRRNIKDFNATYMLCDRDGDMTVTAVFSDGRLKVSNKPTNNSSVKIIFKDQKALFEFLLSQKPDIIEAILGQNIFFEGNLNYATKFVYMATHLRLKFVGS